MNRSIPRLVIDAAYFPLEATITLLGFKPKAKKLMRKL